jgi:DNA-binding NarL/FixJ family response regulator
MTLTALPGITTAIAEEQRAYRVLLIDARCLFRQALRALLDAQPQFSVVGEADRGSEALRLVGLLNPDLVLTDLELTDGNGVAFIETLSAQYPRLRVLVLTAVRARGMATAARRAGAAGYLLKDCKGGELLTALREISAGRWYCSVVPAPVWAAGQDGGGDDLGAQAAYLTERQRQVLRAVALGHSTREIARMLGVSQRAIHGHRERLRNKLQLSGTAALTRFAALQGLTPDTSATS